MPERPCIAAIRLAAAAALITGGVVAGGCYERVVRVKGQGVGDVDVYEPNLKNERIPVVDDLEDAIMGPR